MNNTDRFLDELCRLAATNEARVHG
ncbi:protein YrbN [Enterobacillus tribolii]|nr:protein YrbN [Enterobacillus tribolii]